jgi:hypothetical protein
MDNHVTQLLKRLDFLGYRSFQIKMIICEAIGVDSIKNVSHAQYVKVINALEKYEQLGLLYSQSYSK